MAVFGKAAAAFCCALFVSANALAATDPVAFSFAFVGCNRLDKDGVTATGSKSTANEAQLRQDLQDLARQKPAPDVLILAGDIVKAMKPGTKALGDQLDHWVKFFRKNNGLDPKRTRVVVFTGNHEMLQKTDSGSEIPNGPAYSYWPAAMPGFIAGSDGPVTGQDGLLGDESRLSYTFRQGGNLFMVLDTDSQIDQQTIGDIPLDWIKQKLAAAQRDPTVANIFVMGHKPIAAPFSTEPDASIRSEQAAQFYALLGDPAGDGSPSKVRAYLAAHAHLWHYDSGLAFNGQTGKIPQVVAGNGGSPPEKNWQGPSAYFGYTLVSVSKSGKIIAQSFGREIPDPFYLQKAKPAKLIETETLYQP